MRVVFLWRPLKSLVKGETWRVVGDLSWEDLLEKHEDLSDFEPDSCAHVRVVPVVTDVLVSPSPVVTEFCEVFCVLPLIGEDVVPQSFSFTKKVCTLLYKYARRDVV